MRRILFAGPLVALLVGGLAGAADLAVGGDTRTQASPMGSTMHGDDGKSAKKDKAHRDKAHKPKGHAQRADDDWRAAWRALTPAQREARMQALVKAHAEGMEKWRTCVTNAGTDRAKRATCDKPLPPGLAKRQS